MECWIGTEIEFGVDIRIIISAHNVKGFILFTCQGSNNTIAVFIFGKYCNTKVEIKWNHCGPVPVVIFQQQ